MRCRTELNFNLAKILNFFFLYLFLELERARVTEAQNERKGKQKQNKTEHNQWAGAIREGKQKLSAALCLHGEKSIWSMCGTCLYKKKMKNISDACSLARLVSGMWRLVKTQNECVQQKANSQRKTKENHSKKTGKFVSMCAVRGALRVFVYASFELMVFREPEY